MAKIGEFFSEDIKNEIAKNKIIIGFVIKGHVTQTTPPKFKRFIILGSNIEYDKVGVIFINSEINWKVLEDKQDLKDLQYPVFKANNDYIDRDSYIDCSKLFELNYTDLHTCLKDGRATVLGNLNEDDLEEVLINVGKSPNISLKQREKFNLR